MNKTIHPVYLIIGGIIFHLVGLFIGGIIGSSVGLIADIAFLIGIVNLIVQAVKKVKVARTAVRLRKLSKLYD